MTENEFKKLPKPVQTAIKAMGLDINELKGAVDLDAGIGLIEGAFDMNDADKKRFENAIGASEEDNPVASFMEFLDEMFDTDNTHAKDDTDEDTDADDCPMRRFLDYTVEYHDRTPLLMKAIRKNPDVADEVFASMFDVNVEYVTMAKHVIAHDAVPEKTPDGKVFIVPVHALIKVYAHDENEAHAKVVAAVEEDGAVPANIDGVSDAEEIYGTTCAYSMGDIHEDDIDAVLHDKDDNEDSCPLSSMCDCE